MADGRPEVRPPRQVVDYVVVLVLLALAAAGGAAIFRDSIRGLLKRPAPAEIGSSAAAPKPSDAATK